MYQVVELKTATTTVREYLSNQNVVFALTWQGAKKPDLSLLLGAYYATYVRELKKSGKRHGRKNNFVKTEKLVVHAGGHMRDLRGLAYLPAAVPAGVRVEYLK